MASYYNDLLVDGGSAQTAGLETDYGNRGQDNVFTSTTGDFYNAPSGPGLPETGLTQAAKAEPVLTPDKNSDRSNPPTAPAGYRYIWIGGTNTGSWQLYADDKAQPSVSGSGGGGGGPTTGSGSLPHGAVSNSFQNADGTFTVVYADGFTQVTGNKTSSTDTPSGQNAIQLLTSVFSGYGLSGDIASAITGLIKENYTADTITAIIQDPAAVNSSDPSVKAMAQAWQSRFSANVARQKAGLPVLSPAEYLATEAQYKDVMIRAGLPAATISNDYIAKLMTVDVSPVETQQRIDAARAAITSEDPYVIQQLNAMGLGTGDMVLHLLDPSVASNVIAQKVAAAQIGGEASRAGVNTTQDYAMQLAAQGITQAQAQQGFQTIAQQLPGTQALAARYQGFGTPQGIGSQLQTAVFGTPGTQTQAQAEAELKRLQTQEVSAFSGSSGAGKGSLGISDTSGLQ